MPRSEVSQLLSRLRAGGLRSRTALLLLPSSEVGQELDLAARLNIEPVDYAALLSATLREDARFLGISATSEEARLDELAMASGDRDCVLVYNIDLVLARLPAEDRRQLWTGLRERFPHRPRILLLAVPEESRLLVPQEEEWQSWERSGRIVRLGS